MSLKIDFVERHAKGETISALCREYGVSRPTGHKWTKRFAELGYAGLDDESRRPKTAPLSTAEELVMAILEAREAHPRWGPQTLAPLLARKFGDDTPSHSTIARILKRANKVQARRRKPPTSVVDRVPHVEALAPNDVWTVDFKGWWRALNGERCEPLTVRDAFSRFVLATDICSAKSADVRKTFERLFRRHGVPRAIQSDNGVPFVCVTARCGLSMLSAWWVSLGIRIIRSRPACPQDNGGHERMHADMSADVEKTPAETPRAQQRALDRWRQEFNHVRPHQALGGSTPAEIYKPTEHHAAVVRKPRYPPLLRTALVGKTGCIKFRGETYVVSGSLRGLLVAIEVLDPMRLRVWFYEMDLGVLEVVPNVGDEFFENRIKKKKRQLKRAA